MNIKEYLNPKDWSLHLVNVDNDAAGKDWIEVPDGAEYLLRHKDDGDELFFKEDFNLMSTTDQDGDWFLSNFDKYIGDKIGYMIENYQSEVLWQRHTQPESLPFVYDEVQDNVNHPKHYTSDPSGIECIEITRHRNFNIGNAIKYLWRNGLKDSDSQVQDLQKAVWYINDEIKRLESITNRDGEGR